MTQSKKQSKGLTQIGFEGSATGPCAGSAGERQNGCRKL